MKGGFFMHLFYLDAYFRLAARGDKQAFLKMYRLFHESANIEMHAAKKIVSNFHGFPEDFTDFVDKLFYSILQDYDPDRGSFRWYTSYILEKKLAPVVKKAIIETVRQYSPSVSAPEIIYGIEDVPDPDQISNSTNLAMSKFTYKICSPSAELSKEDKLRQNIMLLQYAGYSAGEICDELKISRSTLRYQQKKIEEDDVMLNLKLELK